MRASPRPALVALGVAWLMSAALLAGSGPAFAQANPPAAPTQAAPNQAAPQPPAEAPALKQVVLTAQQIEAVLAAQKDMDAVAAKLPDNAPPDQKVIGALDAVAKKHGFASYDEYNNVVDNISLVLGGFDPATRQYVGPEAVIKAQIAQVEADNRIPAKDKQEAVAELNDMLKSAPPPVENKANIDLVAKYYDRLIAALGADEN